MADIRLVRPDEMAEAAKLSDSIFRDAAISVYGGIEFCVSGE
ncbi:hypothetical protein [Paenibacillus sp. MZ04-78.2]|nr:hypothetical protein [Paenibacillus sp. MZ04-78.2]